MTNILILRRFACMHCGLLTATGNATTNTSNSAASVQWAALTTALGGCYCSQPCLLLDMPTVAQLPPARPPAVRYRLFPSYSPAAYTWREVRKTLQFNVTKSFTETMHTAIVCLHLL
jgi:hypothetical protein